MSHVNTVVGTLVMVPTPGVCGWQNWLRFRFWFS